MSLKCTSRNMRWDSMSRNSSSWTWKTVWENGTHCAYSFLCHREKFFGDFSIYSHSQWIKTILCYLVITVCFMLSLLLLLVLYVSVFFFRHLSTARITKWANAKFFILDSRADPMCMCIYCAMCINVIFSFLSLTPSLSLCLSFSLGFLVLLLQLL